MHRLHCSSLRVQFCRKRQHITADGGPYDAKMGQSSSRTYQAPHGTPAAFSNLRRIESGSSVDRQWNDVAAARFAIALDSSPLESDAELERFDVDQRK